MAWHPRPGGLEEPAGGVENAAPMTDDRPFPDRRRRRETAADAAVHAVGLVAGLAGCAALFLFAIPGGAASGQGARLAGLAAYAVALMAMLACSALYNLSPPSPRAAVLRRLDHAAIFLLIAGTYSPFMAGALDVPALAMLLGGVWVVALLGMVLKLALPGRFERLSIVLYLALGWSGLLALEPLLDRLPATVLALLGAGGVLYSIGVVFHLWTRLPYQRAIWHGFVLAAAVAHYAAVVLYISA